MSDAAQVLRVGCPMWAHRPWVGRFYPSGTRPGTELGVYSTWCNAVEGNTTFYAEPPASTIAKWREQTPDDFRFAFKLPRSITHDKRLHDVATEVRSFIDAVTPLGPRLGPIQVQLSGSFGPDRIDVLLAFLRRLPGELTWSLEVRHPGFFDGSPAHRALDELCQTRSIGRVVLDTRPLYAVAPDSDAARDEQRSKPDLPVVLDAAGPHPIVRLIGEDRPEGTLAGLVAWVPQFVTWLVEGRRPYMFVHQPENLDSPGLARAFHEEVAAAHASVAPLPAPAGQSSMF